MKISYDSLRNKIVYVMHFTLALTAAGITTSSPTIAL
jgi:hypothetical protein